MSHTGLHGFSLIGGERTQSGGAGFRAVNPATGEKLVPEFHTATGEDLARAASLAEAAAPVLGALSARERAAFLRAVAAELGAATEAIVARAHLETGLPFPRLQGEMGRTMGQFRLFADVLDDGLWLDARIDEALPERKPAPRADIRSMLLPLGPVAVFGASNFPLAFSVAGGDTASALAAGNPVVVKAHPAHPGTSELVGRAVQRAIAKAGLPAGVFALLFDAGIDVGRALVEHPAIKAVGFTGSTAAGQALMRLCAARPEPIPVYAEMGSANPLFILPGALRERSSAIAQHLQISFTLGSGQMCTKPGLVFLPGSGSAPFLTAFQAGAAALAPQQMLTPGIRSKYASAIQERKAEGLAASIAEAQAQVPAGQAAAIAEVFSVTLSEFQATPELEEEIFGPTTLLIHYGPGDDLLATARSLHGHLTATIHASEEDLPLATELARVLQGKAGRVIFNGYPTGVEVCAAMVHGGPFPSTSDGRSSSVGTRAILRFARPVCFQDYPDAALPRELQRANPLGILRLVNGTLSRDAQA